MQRFMLNLGLAVAWMALTGSVSEWNFLAGMAVGAVIITVYSGATGEPSYLGRGLKLLAYVYRFLRAIVHSNFTVAYEILTPRMHQTPRLIRYPVDGLSDAHRTALASAITLTPGTLVVEVSPDNRFLYIHCMYAEDCDRAVSDLDAVARLVQKGMFA